MTYDVLDQIDNDEVDAAAAADDDDNDDDDEDVRGLVRVRSVMMIRTRGIDPTFLKVTQHWSMLTTGHERESCDYCYHACFTGSLIVRKQLIMDHQPGHSSSLILSNLKHHFI